MTHTMLQVLRARTTLIDELIVMMECAAQGQRQPDRRPLAVWEDLMAALAELRALPVSRRQLEAIKGDVSSMEQVMHAWAACGYHPTYGVGRQLLQRVRSALCELLAATPAIDRQRQARVEELAA